MIYLWSFKNKDKLDKTFLLAPLEKPEWAIHRVPLLCGCHRLPAGGGDGGAHRPPPLLPGRS